MLNDPVLLHTKNMPPQIKEVWQTLDLATFNAARAIYTGPYSALKGALPVRDSKERDRRAWGMRDTIANIWARAIKSLHDPIWDMPVIDRLREAVAVAIVAARDHGAITASWSDTLLEHNRSCYSVCQAMPQDWIHYVNGERYASWDEARPHLGDNLSSNPAMCSRHEWRDRPGHPLSAPIKPLSQDTARSLADRFDRWTPIREPRAYVDMDRNYAIRAISRAFAWSEPHTVTT